MSYAHQVTAGTGVNSYSPRVAGTPDPIANPNEFEVTFVGISGPDGPRSIDARATDSSLNVGQDIVPITVPEPGLVAAIIFGMVFLSMLRKRKSGWVG